MTDLVSTISATGPNLAPEASVARSAAQRPFREIFEQNADRVWRTLRTLGVDEASVDDALQDVFLVVHRKLESFEGRAQLSTWIYAVAYRVAQNYRRKAQKHEHSEIPDAAPCPHPDPAAIFAQGQAANFVEQFCSRLEESQRDVFVLCVLEKRTAPEAAELLQVNVNTVYSRIRNTRARFRAELKQLQREAKGEADES